MNRLFGNFDRGGAFETDELSWLTARVLLKGFI